MLGKLFPRRQFLQGAFAAGALGKHLAWGQSPSSGAGWVLLGTQTGEGIYRARWDAATGRLGTPELAASTPRPTFLARHPTLPVVYCGNEMDGTAAAVSSFNVTPSTAALTPLATQQTHGSSPCFVSVDQTGQLLFAANYGGGSLAVFPLYPQGKPAPAAKVFSCANSGSCGTPGPVHDRQDGPHIHCAVLSPGNRFVLACDLGDDAILAFPIHPGQTPALGPPQRIPARLGSGPRHLAFHPNGRWLYCIHELDCTVDRYTWQDTGGAADAQLVPESVVHLAPAGPGVHNSIPNTAAEIAITRDGHFLYTCTRGANQIASFRIEAATGVLRPLQQLPCGGDWPRFFAVDPSERWLLCTNQNSNNVAIFMRDATTGMLTPHGSQAVPSPMCVVWL